MDELSLPDVSVLAAPLYVTLIAIEVWFLTRLGRKEEVTKDLWMNVVMGAGNAITGLFLFTGVTALFFWLWRFRLLDLGITWWSAAFAMVANDFVYYWVHRLQHRIRWGWASHVVHHSSQGYNLSTALRQPWFSVLTGTYLLGIPFILLGIHPVLWAFCGGLNLFYQFFIHTQTVRRLPDWFEAVFNTPSHHRVHHATNPRYLDTNYAGILIIWDKVFGTFAPEEDSEPCAFGLVSNIDSANPVFVATHEYIAIAKDVARPGLRLIERFRYAFAPPGYSHDGSRLSTAEIKRRAGVGLSGGQTAPMADAPPAEAGAPAP